MSTEKEIVFGEGWQEDSLLYVSLHQWALLRGHPPAVCLLRGIHQHVHFGALSFRNDLSKQ